MNYCSVNKTSVVDVIYVFLSTPLSQKKPHATSILYVKIAFSSHAYQLPSVCIHINALSVVCSYCLHQVNVVCPTIELPVEKTGLERSPLEKTEYSSSISRVTVTFSIRLTWRILLSQNNRQTNSTGDKGLFTISIADDITVYGKDEREHDQNLH